MVASARHRGVRLGEKPAVPRISDLGHLYSSSLGKLELDMMGSQQMSERQVLEAIMAEAISKVFEEYVEKHGLDEIAEVFGKGVKIEVGDMLPSSHYAERLKRVPQGVGEGVRGEPQRRARRCGRRASSSCWRGCTPATASRGRRSTGGSRMRSDDPCCIATVECSRPHEGDDMPRTKAKPVPPPPALAANGPTTEVLTLAEAATYLRLPEEEVVRLVRTRICRGGRPGRNGDS